MARVIVTNDTGRTLFSERVEPVHLESEQSAIQLLDRLEWAIREGSRRRPLRRRRRVSPVPKSDRPETSGIGR